MAAVDLETVYRGYIDEYARHAFQEFDVRRLLLDQPWAPDELGFDEPLARQKLRFRGVVMNEIATIKEGFVDEFAALLDTIEADAPIDDGLDAVIERNPIAAHVAEDRRERFRGAIRRDLRKAATALEPLVACDDVWREVRRRWSLDGAHHRLMRWFETTARYEEFVDDITVTVDTDSVTMIPVDTVDYSTEAVRVLSRGRDYVRRVVSTDLEAAWAQRRPPTVRGARPFRATSG